MRNLSIFKKEELSKVQQDFILSVIHESLGEGELVGIYMSALSWDMRPIVVDPKDNKKKVIRLLGPEIASSSKWTLYMEDFFERKGNHPEISSNLVVWGKLSDGQMYYVREIVSKTLSQELSEGGNLVLLNSLEIAKALVDKLSSWHSFGLVHGHLCLDNIYLDENSKISFLDPEVAATLILAHEEEGFPHGYEPSEFAPELKKQGTLIYRSDLYCLGLVLREIFKQTDFKSFFQQNNNFNEAKLRQKLKNISEALMSELPNNRPSLEIVRLQIEDAISSLSSLGDSYAKGELKGFPSDKNANLGFNKLQSTEIGKSSQLAQHSPNADFMISATKGEKGKKISYAIGGLILCFLVAIFLFFGGDSKNEVKNTNLNDLEQLWSSQIPSQMQPVALEALSDSEKSELARNIIIKSALNQSNPPPGLNSRLIRLAYDPRWEVELSAIDRKVVLTLALAPIVRQNLSASLPKLEDLHPAVIFSILSSLNGKIPSYFSSIPVSKLASLPSPLGEVFSYMSTVGIENCDNKQVSEFARFASEPYSKDSLRLYLKDSKREKIAFLAVYSKSNLDLASDILLELYADLNPLPEVAWAKNWNLTSFKSISQSDLLKVISGVLPETNISQDLILKMVSHPSNNIRAFALREILAKQNFEHPGAKDAIEMIINSPEILAPDQTIKLLHLLEDPFNVSEERVKSWLRSEPKPKKELVELLLLSMLQEARESKLDNWLLSYLKDLEPIWEPSAEVLSKLRAHPAKVVRLYAYAEIFKKLAKEEALPMLLKAEKAESDKELRRKLREMIDVLKL